MLASSSVHQSLGLGIKQAILKLDIENAEPGAIAGATQLLRDFDVPFIQMEWSHAMILMREGKDNSSIFAWKQMAYRLQDLGYIPTALWNKRRLRNLGMQSWPNDVAWRKVRF